VAADVGEGLRGIVGQEIILITWFHLASRDVPRVHPQDDMNVPLTGVFLTRSPDRPNPLGLHRVKVLEVAGTQFKVGPWKRSIEAAGRRVASAASGDERTTQ
jgi:tRNA (Thr-GGU) A37 N-methylase